MIRDEAELDELLSSPSAEDVEAMLTLGGDLLILGAGGKMGPTLAMRARLALDPAHRVIAVARFSNAATAEQLRDAGIEVITADLLEPGALDRLPDAPNVVFMAAMKFGTSGNAALTWAMNVYLPGLVAERYRESRIVTFSTGNVYPLVPVNSGGATEMLEPAPVGEYAQSALGRERLFAYGSQRYGTPVAVLRLNYAAELRYGVLLDIGTAVFERRPVDLRMSLVNVIWQGDANSQCLRSFAHCSSPPAILNIAGPETLSIQYIAAEFGRRFGVEPVWANTESDTALLNNSAKATALFGYPSVTPLQLIDWTATWIGMGGSTHGKPTHFQTRDGRF